MEDLKETKAPARCPHCRKICSQPPSWMGVLALLSGGKGKPPSELTAAAATPLLGVGIAQTRIMFKKCLQEKMIEPIGPGSNTFRKTRYGTQILSRWRGVDWVYRRPGKVR